MDHRRAKELLERYRQGRCSDAERQQVESWYLRATDEMSEAELGEPSYARIDQRLRRHLPLESGIRVKRITRLIPYAAAAVIVLATGLFFLDKNNRQQPTDNTLTTADIQPGGNRATLTLGDGRSIVLSEQQTGIIVGDGITYTDGTDLDSGDDSLTDLELTTPKGGTYQVVLPDGSSVWLNAASTLKYPSRFIESRRMVEITGEAYFSIAKDEKRPFTVKSNGQQIEVLGTEFNVSAYPDEDESKTTLVNGAIAIINLQSNAITKLKPGHQATTNGAQTDIKQVDTRLYTSWKDGYFNFKSTPLEEALRQVSRWYDVEVEFRNGIPDDVLGGQIKRDVTLLGLIEILQVSNINATLEGRVLIVN